MKELIKQFLKICKVDYNFKTFTSTALSLIIGLEFSIYNGFLGIKYISIWNLTICIYYVLLTIVRGIIVNSQRKTDSVHNEFEKEHRKKIYIATHIILFVMNMYLIVPIATMINGDRIYNWGLIPAIAMAAYKTYRIVIAIMNYSKSRKTDNVFVRELRTANLIDTLVAVLTLQNTMIIVNEGEIAGNMKNLSIISSASIWLIIVALSVLSFRRSIKMTDK